MEDDLTYDQKKQWAKTLYTKEEKTITEISKTVTADEAKVRSWIKDDRWDDVKRSLLISKKRQLENFYDGLQTLSEKKKENNPDAQWSTKDLDMAIKYTAAIKSLEEETGIPYIVQVAEQFTSWLLHRDLELAKVVTVQFDAYIKQLPI